jgi:hypothetical protein
MTRKSRRSLAVQPLIAAFLSTAGIGCSGEDGQGVGRFCSDARQVMNDVSFPPDGAGVVADLRSIDVSGLVENDRAVFASALDEVESQITKFNAGQGLDGWSTQAAADIATRICGSDMTSFNVIP